MISTLGVSIVWLGLGNNKMYNYDKLKSKMGGEIWYIILRVNELRIESIEYCVNFLD